MITLPLPSSRGTSRSRETSTPPTKELSYVFLVSTINHWPHPVVSHFRLKLILLLELITPTSSLTSRRLPIIIGQSRLYITGILVPLLFQNPLKCPLLRSWVRRFHSQVLLLIPLVITTTRMNLMSIMKTKTIILITILIGTMMTIGMVVPTSKSKNTKYHGSGI